ncbi:hypothetical protein C3B58_13890, partial [Lactonifactor longoviformis]
YKNEIIRFQKVLEEKFGITITEEDIRRATHLRNEERKALKAFYELMKLDPAPMKGQDLFQILYGSTFKFDKEKVVSEINAIREKVESEYKEGKCLDKRPRILVTGSPVAGGAMKVVKAIEDNGGVVVAFENCGGARSIEALVDEDAPDIYQALASRYLSLGCSCMSPNPNRYRLMGELIEDYKADAVVDVVLQACHTYNVETMGIKKYVKEQYGIPYMSLETDYSTGDIGQLNTRMAAFIEML